ncbi:MAG TPA: class I lanthipeptide [Thermoanaerobaculia bacterium]|nr:class I lanthipeptide [Thermoanaerobaculia bacterium]
MRKSKKLTLSRETLVNLGTQQLKKAEGGVAAAGPTENGYFTCNETVCGTCSCGMPSCVVPCVPQEA